MSAGVALGEAATLMCVRASAAEEPWYARCRLDGYGEVVRAPSGWRRPSEGVQALGVPLVIGMQMRPLPNFP